VENPKDSTPKLLELIQEFSNMAGYQINAQESVAFLYTNNVTGERELKEWILFTVCQNHKLSRNNPNQRGKGFVLRKL